MYVDFAYYSGTYGGNAVPEGRFPAAVLRAEAHIRALTYLNGDIFAQKDERIKLAVCAAAEAVYRQEAQAAQGGAGIKSETNDGYSISYVTEAQDGQTAGELLLRKVAAAVRPSLLPTGWLSRRVKMGGGCDGGTDGSHPL